MKGELQMKVGIDLGGSHIAIGVVDSRGVIIEKIENGNKIFINLCL